MKTVEELKQNLKNKEFAKLFAGAESAEDIVKIAHDNGYDITLSDAANYELSDDMLENIAGGKYNDTKQQTIIDAKNKSDIQVINIDRTIRK